MEGAVRVGSRAHRGAVSTGRAKWPLLLSSERRFPSFPRGFRRSSADSEVPVSLPVPTYPDGVSSRFSRMHPNLSDCPGTGADESRRMGTEPFRWPLKCRIGRLEPMTVIHPRPRGRGFLAYNHVRVRLLPRLMVTTVRHFGIDRTTACGRTGTQVQ